MGGSFPEEKKSMAVCVAIDRSSLLSSRIDIVKESSDIGNTIYSVGLEILQHALKR